MELQKVLELIKEEIQPTLDGLNAYIVEATLKRAGKRVILRLLVDKEGGINIDECALINSHIGNIIEDKDIITQRYLLEVSSPGLDRPMKTKADFERSMGKDIEIWLAPDFEGGSFLTARIKRVEEGKVILEDKDCVEVCVPYGMVNKARLKI